MLRIKQLREEKGISQLEFAKKINLTQQSVSAYEKGIREPSLDILKTIADFFGVTTDFLLGKSDIRNPEKVEIDPLDLAKFGFSLKNYEPLSEKQKEQVRDLLKVVLKDNLKDKEKKDEDK